MKYPEMARKEISLSGAAHLQFPWYQLVRHVRVSVLVWVVPFPPSFCALLPGVCAHRQLSNVPFLEGKSFPEVSAWPGDKGETATGGKAGREVSEEGPKQQLSTAHTLCSSPAGT